MRITRECSVANCGKTVAARGWCAVHYHHWKQHGDPLAGRFYGGRVLAYEGAHARVKTARGRARDYRCQCGDQALDWAYDNEDPNELVSEKGYAYSMDPEHYIPMCRRCHRRHDIQHRIAAAAAYRALRFGGASSA